MAVVSQGKFSCVMVQKLRSICKHTQDCFKLVLNNDVMLLIVLRLLKIVNATWMLLGSDDYLKLF